MASELFTADFWQRTATQAVHFAAGGALSPVLDAQVKAGGLTGGLPWSLMALGAVAGGILSVLVSLSSVKVPNTVPASFLPTKLVDGGDNDASLLRRDGTPS